MLESRDTNGSSSSSNVCIGQSQQSARPSILYIGLQRVDILPLPDILQSETKARTKTKIIGLFTVGWRTAKTE